MMMHNFEETACYNNTQHENVVPKNIAILWVEVLQRFCCRVKADKTS